MTAKSKLNEARRIFHAKEIKKTGWNSFSNYPFFELADFLVPAMGIFYDLKLSAIVSFGTELATMEITDLEDESSIHRITSPMSTAALKACHEVQNLGAVETYIRRYLWVAALEIVEHEAIDSSEGPEKKAEPKTKPAAKSAKPAGKPPTPKQIALNIMRGVEEGDAQGAAEHLASLGQDERDAIWAHISPEVQEVLTNNWPTE